MDKEYHDIKIGDIIYYYEDPDFKLKVIDKDNGWIKVLVISKGYTDYYRYEELYKVNI